MWGWAVSEKLFLPHLLGLLCRSSIWRGQGLRQGGAGAQSITQGALGATLSQKSEPMALGRDFCSCSAPMACTVAGNLLESLSLGLVI